MTLQKLESQILKIFTLIAGLILFSPLVVFKNLLRPYITSKMFFFETLTLILVGLWVVLLFINFKKYKPRFNLLSIALVVYLGVILVSVIFSANLYRSFWGNAERMEGFIDILFFGVYALALFSVFRDKPETIKKLILVSLVVSLLAVVYPVLQKVGLIFSPPGEGFDRPNGSFGNPAFLSGYILVHLFLALWYLFGRLAKNKKFFTAINIFISSIFIVDFAALVWTQTRGSWLGFVLALIVFAAVAVIALPKKIKIFAGTILLLIIVFGGLFIAFRSKIADSSLGQKVPIIGRLASISLNDSSSRDRWLTWGWSLKWFTDKPIFGAGQDMFYSVFDNNYSANNYDSMPERFDRSHNKFIDLLVMNGVVGLASYLFLLGAIFYLTVKKIKESPELFERISWMLIISLLVAYMVHNFFVFDTPANSLIFFFLVAAFMVFFHKEEGATEVVKNKIVNYKIPGRIVAASVLSIIVLVTIFYYVVVKPYQAASFVAEAATNNATTPETIFNDYQSALALNTFIGTEARAMWADYFIKSLVFSRVNQPLYTPESLDKLSGVLLAELDKGEEIVPMIDFYVYRSGIYAQMTWFPNLDPTKKQFYEEQEEKAYSDIAQKWPQRTDFLVTYVEDQIFKGKYDQAAKWLKMIIERTPNYGRAVWLQGIIGLVQNNNVEQALLYISDAIDKGYRWDINNRADIIFAIAPKIKPQYQPLFVKFLENRLAEYESNLDLSNVQTSIDAQLRVEKAKMVISLLIDFGSKDQNIDFKKLTSYFIDGLKYSPTNANYWARLAAVYAKLRDKENAIFAAQKAVEYDPTTYASEAPIFIQYVQNGQWDKLP